MKNRLLNFILLAIVFGCFACDEPDALAEVNADLTSGQGNAYLTVAGVADAVVEGDTTTITISLPNPVGTEVTVDFTFSGDASIDSDYLVTSNSGSVSLNSSGGSGTIVFDIFQGGADNISFDLITIADGEIDPGESFTVSLSGASAAGGTPIDLGILNQGADFTVTINEE